MIQYVKAALDEATEALANLRRDERMLTEIAAAGETLIRSLQASGRIFSCGNGGSMCDAIHFAEELSGRFRKDRRGLPAVAIADPGHLTCVGNDYGYEYVFSRYLESHAKAGDVLVGISTSGKSANVVRAAEVARDIGMSVITLTGKSGSPLGALATHDICTPAGQFSDRVQELHIKIIHTLIELVERRLYPENYSN